MARVVVIPSVLRLMPRGGYFPEPIMANTRGMYYPQGSYGEKGWGKHGATDQSLRFWLFQNTCGTKGIPEGSLRRS